MNRAPKTARPSGGRPSHGFSPYWHGEQRRPSKDDREDNGADFVHYLLAAGHTDHARSARSVEYLLFTFLLHLRCFDLLDILRWVFFEILQAILAAELNLQSVLFKNVRFAHITIKLFA